MNGVHVLHIRSGGFVLSAWVPHEAMLVGISNNYTFGNATFLRA
jgi:hypothetical protein